MSLVLFTCFVGLILAPGKIGFIQATISLFAVSLGAVAMGISSLERHITLDRAMYGSDQSASMEPNGLRQLIGAVLKIKLAMGMVRSE